nr:hypothetical protein Iba_chr07cCG13210 [Ipomoea batatas]
MVSNKSFSLIFSLLLITAFLNLSATNATSRRFYATDEGAASAIPPPPPGFSPKSDRRYTTVVGASRPPPPEYRVPGHGSPGGIYVNNFKELI